jgi:Cd2+/Zn2+-exporting ATPase
MNAVSIEQKQASSSRTTHDKTSNNAPPNDDGVQSIFSQAWLEPRFVVVTLIAIIASFIGERLDAPAWLILVFNITSYIAGGLFGAKEALNSLLERKIDVDLLMILAALGAASIGEWHEGAILLFLFSLSNVLQDYAIGRSRNAIKSLLNLYPKEARVRRGDSDDVQMVALEDLQLGDIVLIEPGERIPVDGDIVQGKSHVDQSPITGESIPVAKAVGDEVFAGTLNKQGILDVKTTKLASESTLSRIIKLVEDAQENQAPTERWLDKFEQYYAMFILVAVGLFIVIPPALGIVEFDSNFYRAMVLMTVASPCALVISVPASFISAIASSARDGVLLKGGAYLEELAQIKAIAFDKTGTLTFGEPVLTDVVTHEGIQRNDLLALAASTEQRSEHPLARAIVNAAQEENLTLQSISDFEAEAGIGVTAHIEGAKVQIGRVDKLANIVDLPDDLAQTRIALEEDGKTTMGVLHDGAWWGIIAVADTVRPQAKVMVAKLREKGIEPAMLTGDNQRVANAIARSVGITRVFAELMPEDKVKVLNELKAEFEQVAMVGDGVNDAPALAQANVGIAMGAAGTDVALETADVVLMGDKIEQINVAIDLSRKAVRVVWQNIAFSLAVIVMLVAGAFLIDLPLPLGVLGHEGSTVIVVLNGLISLLLLPEIQRRREQQATDEAQVVLA